MPKTEANQSKISSNPYQVPLARPSTPVGDKDRINKQGQAKMHGHRLPDHVRRGPTLNLVDKKGKPVAPPLTPKQVEDKLWERYGKQELLWDNVAVVETGSFLIASLASAGASLKGVIDPSDESLARKIFQDVGISLVPGVRTGYAATRLAIEVAKIGVALNDRRVVEDFTSDKSRRSEMERIALEGLFAILKKDLHKGTLLVGTYTYDVATSVVDFTGLSSLPSSAIRAAKELYDVYRTRKMVEQANTALSDRNKFSLAIFTQVPVLACTMMHDMHEAELMSLLDALPTDEMSKEELDKVISWLSSRDQHAIKKYQAQIAEIKWQAQARVQSAPYGLMKELERRRVEGLLKARLKSKLPGFINPDKPKPQETPQPPQHFGRELTKEELVRRANIAKQQQEPKKPAAPAKPPEKKQFTGTPTFRKSKGK